MLAPLETRFEDLKASERLPSPGGVALEIMRLTQREDAGIPEICRALRADPALVGRLIKLANSVKTGTRRPVVAINDAVTRLGLFAVRQISLGFSLMAGTRTGKCAGMDYNAFWSRSLATAIASQAIATHIRIAAPEECFSLGLLARIGTLALASVYPDDFANVLRQADGKNNEEIRALERAQFAVDHDDLTSAMLESWGFPKPFIDAVYHHPDPEGSQLPEGSRQRQISRSLHLASLLGDLCVMDDTQRRRLLPLLYRIGARLAIDEAALGKLTEEIVGEWKEWGALLSIQTGEVPSLTSIQESRAEVPASDGGQEATGSRYPLRILAVDDDRSTLMVLEKLLTMAGHHVSVAHNGEEGLQQVLRDPPQLIITDWEMPGLDGVKFCRALRETKAGRLMYFIILTGHGNEQRLFEAFDAGADDYMTKPLKPRELVARLRAGQRFIELQQNFIRESEEMRGIAGELAIANRRLQTAAQTDSLTGIPNRYHVLERLDQEFAASLRKDSSLAVLAIDVDHFKAINDAHGHAVGDDVLRLVAKVMRAHCRAEDTVGRIGGEEFLVVCPDTAETDAVKLAERLRVAIEMSVGKASKTIGQVTVSVGVALRTVATGESRVLIARADRALYRAKREGRNRVCVDKADAQPNPASAAPANTPA